MKLKTQILIILMLLSNIAYADRWFGCGTITKLNHYGSDQLRFDIQGFDYEGLNICQWGVNDTVYGHHYLERTPENTWLFSMYLLAYSKGKQVRLYSDDNASGPCKVQNVGIQFCD